MRTRSVGFVVAVISVTSAAHAQTPRLMPITRIDAAAREYITSSGALISQQGNSSPDQMIGRAVPCQAGANGAYVLRPTAAYPLDDGVRYTAEASARTDPLTILSQGVVQGDLAAGPLTASGGSDRLTRLDITETVRLSLTTGAGDSVLGRSSVMRLANLASLMPAGFDTWCVITSVSAWTIRYETYDKRRFNGGVQGLWIVTANGSYSRNASAVVPYQVLTLGITPYTKTWVAEQARVVRVAVAGNPGAALPALGRPDATPVRSLTGALSVDALQRGDLAVENLGSLGLSLGD